MRKPDKHFSVMRRQLISCKERALSGTKKFVLLMLLIPMGTMLNAQCPSNSASGTSIASQTLFGQGFTTTCSGKLESVTFNFFNGAAAELDGYSFFAGQDPYTSSSLASGTFPAGAVSTVTIDLSSDNIYQNAGDEFGVLITYKNSSTLYALERGAAYSSGVRFRFNTSAFQIESTTSSDLAFDVVIDGSPVFNTSNAPSLDEGNTSVIDIDAIDATGGAADVGITYAIDGGDDADLFSINATTGELSFLTVPDFESPQDLDQGNNYLVNVLATSAHGTATQQLTVTVNNVNVAPEILSDPITEVKESATYEYVVITSDADGDDLTLNGIIPDFLSISLRETSVTTVAGSIEAFIEATDPLEAGFRRNRGIALDAAGNLYIAEDRSGVIRKFDPLTNELSVFAGVPNDPGFVNNIDPLSAKFKNPYGIAFDPSGNMFVSDAGNSVIRRIDGITGEVTTYAGSSPGYQDSSNPLQARFFFPLGIAADSQGNVYACDAGNQRIRRIDATTREVTTVAGDGTESFADNVDPLLARFKDPYDVAVDPSGNLLIADRGNHRIRHINMTTGEVSTLAGNGTFGGYLDSANPLSARFNSPQGLTVDAKGNIYVADDLNASVRRIDGSTLAVTTIAGDGPNSPTPIFDGIYDVAKDVAGNVYVSDGDVSLLKRINVPAFVLSGDAAGQLGDYSVSLNLSDGNGGMDTQAFTLTVTDATPPIITSPTEVSVPENTLPAYTIVAEDSNPANTSLIYALNAGTTEQNDNSQFELTDNQVSFDSHKNFESPSDQSIEDGRVMSDGIYHLQFTITDDAGNVSDPIDVDITVTDVNDAPTAIILSSNTILEDEAIGTEIGSLTAVDEDANASHTFSLVSGFGDNVDFDISGSSLTSASLFDFETKATYSIQVLADDGAGGTFEQQLTIEVSDVPAQTITFEELVPKTFGDAAFELMASASSNLEVSIASSDENILSVSGNTATILAAGEVAITATQQGESGLFEAADAVSQMLIINKADQTITFGELSDQNQGPSSITLVATASSGLDVSFTASGPATAIGHMLRLTGIGEVIVTATQTGDDNYNSATNVVRSFTVTDVVPPELIVPTEITMFEGQELVFAPKANETVAVSSSNLPSWITSETRTEASLVTDFVLEEGANDGDISNANLLSSRIMELDAQGNIYFAETGRVYLPNGTFYTAARLKVITTDGRVRTVAGGAVGVKDGHGINAQLENPLDIAIGPDGNIYWSDDSNMIRKITPEGEVTTLVGQAYQPAYTVGALSSAQIEQAFSMGFGPDGKLYYFERGLSGNRRIMRIDLEQEILDFFSGSGVSDTEDGTATIASFQLARDISFDSEGNLYVRDGGWLRKVSPDGSVTTIVGENQIKYGDELIVDGLIDQAIFENGFQSLTITEDNVIYFRDGPMFRQIKDGIVTTLFGNSSYDVIDGPVSNADFRSMDAVKVDAYGFLRFVDVSGDFKHFRRLLPEGTVLTGNSAGNIGTHFFDVTITDVGGNQVTETVTINVLAPVPSGYTASVDQDFITLEPISFTVSDGIVGAEFSYTFTDEVGNEVIGNGTIASPTEQITDIDLGVFEDGLVTFDFVLSNASGDGPNIRESIYKDTEAPVFEPQTINLVEGELVDEELLGPDDRGATIELVSAPDWMNIKENPDKIIVLAGSGAYGFDDGDGTDATFGSIEKLIVYEDFVFNEEENATTRILKLLVADNSAIRIVTEFGNVSTLAGVGNENGYADGSGSAARFNVISSLALLGSDVYVTDRNYTLRKVTPQGVTSTVFGTTNDNTQDGPFASADIGRAGAMTSDGYDLFIADESGDVVKKVDFGNQEYTTVFGSTSAGLFDGFGTTALVESIDGLTYDAISATMYGMQTSPYVVRKFDLETLEVTTLGNAQGSYVTPTTIGNYHPYGGSGISVDGSGNLFVTDDENVRLVMISAQGTVRTLAHSGYSVDGVPETTGALFPGGFYDAVDVAVTSQGEVFFADGRQVFEIQLANLKLEMEPEATIGRTGSYSVVIKATDGVGNQTFQTITVNISGTPEFTSDPILVATQDVEYTYSPEVDDPSGKYTLAVTTLPDWLTFDEQTQTLIGTPTIDDVGVNDVVIEAVHPNPMQSILNARQEFSITVELSNQPPVFNTGNAASLAENTTVVETLSATDPDNDDSLIYSLVGGADQSAFSLSGTVLSFVSAPDFESADDVDTDNVYEVVVQVSDGTNTTELALSVSVTDVNEAPTLPAGTFSIEENVGIGSFVARLVPLDPEEDPMVFSIVSGNDGGEFEIDASGRINVASELNFEITPSYTLGVEVSDGSLSISASITINIEDSNDGPTQTTLSNNAVDENVEIGTVIGSLVTTDEDVNDTHSYELQTTFDFIINGVERSPVAIDGNNLITDVEFDYEQFQSFQVRILIEDSGTASLVEDYTITVNDLNEAPTAIQLSNTAIDEDAQVGSVIGSLTTTDPDMADIHTYEVLTSFELNGQVGFPIVANGADLVTTVPLDFETVPALEIEVQTTDAGGLTFSETFIISTNDVNEAPTAIALSSNTILENEAVGTVIGSLTAVDEDVNAAHTFSLVSGFGDNAEFDISGSSLTNASLFDFETKATYSIQVLAEDGAGGTFEQQLTIEVIDVPAQTIAFEELAPKTFADAAFELVATASSDLAVHFASSDENILSISGTTATILAAGEVAITATQEGESGVFEAAVAVSRMLIINKADQTITFGELSDQNLETGSITLTATASSGLDVSFTASGPATVGGNVLTLTGSGEVTVMALQSGNGNYLAAENVIQTFVITDLVKSDQTITFTLPDFVYVTDQSITLEGSSDSGLDLTYEVISGAEFASVSGNALNLLSSGTAEIAAKQAGSDAFNPAILIKTLEIKPVFTVSGKVTDENGNSFSGGEAFLIPSGQTQGEASALAADGTYAFADVKDGSYILAIDPTDDDAYHVTVYGNAIIYQNATPVVVTTSDLSGLDIQIVTKATGDELDGDGIVTGRVVENDEGTGNRIELGILAEGDPIEGASIFLVRKSDEKILTEVFSDANGDFEITGIPEGTYDILINIPGIEGTISQEVSIVEGEELLMTAIVDEEGIVFTVEEVLALSLKTYLEVYPNPVIDFLTVKIGEGENGVSFEWRIFDLGGQIILEGMSINNEARQVDLRSISNGVYILFISDELGRTSQVKISK